MVQKCRLRLCWEELDARDRELFSESDASSASSPSDDNGVRELLCCRQEAVISRQALPVTPA